MCEKILYVVSDNPDAVKQYGVQFTNFLQCCILKVMGSTQIPKPVNALLHDAWGLTVIETESELLHQSDFIVFDLDCKDQIGLYVMIGMALGLDEPKRLVGKLMISGITVNPIDYLITKFEDGLVPTRILAVGNFEEDESTTVIPLPTDFSCLAHVSSGIYKKLVIDLTDRNFYNLMLAGYCYSRDISVEMVADKYNPILSKIGKLTIKSNDN